MLQYREKAYPLKMGLEFDQVKNTISAICDRVQPFTDFQRLIDSDKSVSFRERPNLMMSVRANIIKVFSNTEKILTVRYGDGFMALAKADIYPDYKYRDYSIPLRLRLSFCTSIDDVCNNLKLQGFNPDICREYINDLPIELLNRKPAYYWGFLISKYRYETLDYTRDPDKSVHDAEMDYLKFLGLREDLAGIGRSKIDENHPYFTQEPDYWVRRLASGSNLFVNVKFYREVDRRLFKNKDGSVKLFKGSVCELLKYNH